MDVAASHSDVVERLEKELATRRSEAAASRLVPDSEAAQHLDGKEIDRLRALGYVR